MSTEAPGFPRPALNAFTPDLNSDAQAAGEGREGVPCTGEGGEGVPHRWDLQPRMVLSVPALCRHEADKTADSNQTDFHQAFACLFVCLFLLAGGRGDTPGFELKASCLPGKW
jgi:hypothetical protein